MKYFYIVYQGRSGNFGSFVSYTETGLDIAEASKAACIAANGFAVVTNWLEISEEQFKAYSHHVERVHFIDQTSESDEEEGVQ